MSFFSNISNLNKQIVSEISDVEQNPELVELRSDVQENLAFPVVANADEDAEQILRKKIDANRVFNIPVANSGIENLYVDVAADLIFDYSFFKQNFDVGNKFPTSLPIRDKFRFASKKFWNVVDGKTIYFLKKDFQTSEEVPFEIQFNENASSIKTKTIESGLRETKTVVKLVPNKRLFSLYMPDGTIGEFIPELWKNYVTGAPDSNWDKLIEFNKVFSDHSFSVSIPFQDTSEPNEKFFNVESKYNYYHELYEEVSALPSVSENYLPSLYLNYLLKNSRAINERELLEIATLYGRMINVAKSIRNSNGSYTLYDYYEIFNEWPEHAPKLSGAEKSELISRMSHVLFTEDDIDQELLQKVHSMEPAFPGSIKLQFSADPIGSVKALFNSSNKTDILINAIANADIAEESITTPERDVANTSNASSRLAERKISKRRIRFFSDPNNIAENLVKEKALTVYDLDQFILTGGDETSFVNDYDENLIQNMKISFNAIIDKREDTRNTFENIVARAILKGKINKLINNNVRTATELFSGSLCYSDTLFYKIEKYKVINDVVSQDPIQTFYLPCSDKPDITFFDTQVKYKNRYHYKIIAYVAVFGTEYEYSSFHIRNVLIQNTNPLLQNINDGLLQAPDDVYFDNQHNAYFNILQRPKVEIIEVPYAESGVTLYDLPPTSPSVEFIPFAVSTNEVKISIATTYGETLEKPIVIFQSDARPIANTKRSQKIDRLGRIKYGGDDKVSKYQIMRLTYHPESVRDFANSLSRYLDTNTPDRVGAKTRETSYNEVLQYNTKYYYIFRSVDVHNNISNPTSLFEVEIVNNDGVIYTVVKNVDYLNKDKKFKTKNVKKYLRIRAATRQKNYDVNQFVSNLSTGKYVDVGLGPNNENMWNRRFKFRLTSRDTGRKIDINVKFGYDIRGYQFTFVAESSTQPMVVYADSFTEALHLLLIEQNFSLI